MVQFRFSWVQGFSSQNPARGVPTVCLEHALRFWFPAKTQPPLPAENHCFVHRRGKALSMQTPAAEVIIWDESLRGWRPSTLARILLEEILKIMSKSVNMSRPLRCHDELLRCRTLQNGKNTKTSFSDLSVHYRSIGGDFHCLPESAVFT